MAFARLSFGKTWESALDFPTYEDSETQVRADLQYHPDAIRDFINSHLTALESEGAAGNIGAAGGSLQNVLNAYLARFVSNENDIEALASGGVPVVSQCVRVSFSASDWVEDGEGSGVSFAIPLSVHKRSRSAYGFNLWETAEGGALSATWNTACTQVLRDDETGEITLTAPAAYAGAAVFFGV